MRLFISIDIPDEIKENIHKTQSKILRKYPFLKQVSRDNLHITLKFLGEVDEGSVNNVVNILSTQTENINGFTASLQGISYFGRPTFIKVIYIDISKGVQEMKSLMKSLNSSLDHIRKEEHEPVPHITIFRVPRHNDTKSLSQYLSNFSDVLFGEFYVNEIKLKKSTLTPEGPLYSDLKSFTVKS